MTEFIQLLWSGILNGMLYALIGLSLVLIFKTARILNFAAGTMAGFTGWFAWWWATKQGIPFLLAILVAIVMVAVATLLIERLTIRPLINENFLSIVTITLGLEFLISNLSINFPASLKKKNILILKIKFYFQF